VLYGGKQIVVIDMSRDEAKEMKRTTYGVLVALCVLLAFMPANASDFTLEIFGNANMDDIIDELDVEYVQGILDGTNDETDLADANYDGVIDEGDIAQIELIIAGEEKKLTYIDIFGENETVNTPVKRLANLGGSSIQVARMLNSMDILLPVVGADKSSQPIFYPEFSTWHVVGGNPPDMDYEYILSLEPDAVQPNLEGSWALVGEYPAQKKELKEKLPGIPLICLNMREPDTLSKNVRTYGYLLDRRDEAEEFISWHEGLLNTLKSRTETLSTDELPRVFFERGSSTPYECAASGSRYGQALAIAGGYNIVDEIIGPDDPKYGTITVGMDPEWVIEQNPEIILVAGYLLASTGARIQSGYETDDSSAMAAKRQEILDRPELANVDAVKNGQVYVLDTDVIGGSGPECLIGAAYMAKLFHPELFEDLDPKTIHQEYVDKFCHIDFDVDEHGVFVYPS